MTTSSPRAIRQQLPLLVGLVSFALSLLFSIWVLAAVGWDATVFVGFGEDAIATRVYGEERLGPVQLRPEAGHDGKFFFVQANDPWVLDPDVNARVLDRPLYRSQRMLYPVLAGAGGALSPSAIVWGLLVVNILAMGAGTWATALIAQSMGVSAWWGLAFALNPGLISEMMIDGAGIVSSAAAFGAVALILRRRLGIATLLLALAALSREAMLIAAVGSGWWVWKHGEEPRKAFMVVTTPVAAVGLWAVYLRLRLGWSAGVSQVEEIGWPFVGFVQAAESWIGDPLNLVVGFTILALFLVYSRRALISPQLVGWAFLGFVAFGVLFTEQVWNRYFNITRAIAPVITAFVLLVVSSDKPGQSDVRAAT